jgi:hypothetical protein
LIVLFPSANLSKYYLSLKTSALVKVQPFLKHYSANTLQW